MTTLITFLRNLILTIKCCMFFFFLRICRTENTENWSWVSKYNIQFSMRSNVKTYQLSLHKVKRHTRIYFFCKAGRSNIVCGFVFILLFKIGSTVRRDRQVFEHMRSLRNTSSKVQNWKWVRCYTSYFHSSYSEAILVKSRLVATSKKNTSMPWLVKF